MTSRPGSFSACRTRDQPLDDPVAAGGGSLGARGQRLAAREWREPIEHRQPEPPLVVLVVTHRHRAGVRAETGLGDPRAQQGGLPTRRRRGDDGHGVCLGKPLEERRPQDRRLRRAPGPQIRDADGSPCAMDQRHDRRAGVDRRGAHRAGARCDVVRYEGGECAHAVPFVGGGGTRATIPASASLRKYRCHPSYGLARMTTNVGYSRQPSRAVAVIIVVSLSRCS